MSAFDTFDARLDAVAAGQGDFWETLDGIRVEVDASLNSGELGDMEWRVLKNRANRIHDKLWIARQQPGYVGY